MTFPTFKKKKKKTLTASPYKTVPYLLQNIFVQNTTEKKKKKKTITEKEWTVRPTSEL